MWGSKTQKIMLAVSADCRYVQNKQCRLWNITKPQVIESNRMKITVLNG